MIDTSTQMITQADMNAFNTAMIILFFAFIGMAILTIVVQKAFHNKNQQYALKQSSQQKTGAQVAQMILEKNGITNIRVLSGTEGQDHYNPATGVISLSPSVYNSSSVSAMAIAAHECGHAIQFHKGEVLMKARNTLAKPVAIATQVGSAMFSIGFMLWIFTFGGKVGGLFLWFTLAGLIMYAAMGLFQLITLPVEFGASRKAKKQLTELGLMVTENDKVGTKGVLNAAAMTYVVAFLTTMVMLAMFIIRFLLILKSRN